MADQFETAWKEGKSPRLEDYLSRFPASQSNLALTSLLRVELELRHQRGESPAAGEYQARFPQQAGIVAEVLAEPLPASVVDTSRAGIVSDTMTAAAGNSIARQDEPLPATINRFAIQGLIGQGAFGRVLRARDPELERDVAIKIPRAGTLAKPDDVQRFLREGKAAATMQHPNICPVYEVGTANGRPYIVMALIPGKSLADHLEQLKEPMAERQAALITRKLAQALELAHGKGIVHRDLKPANILIDRDRKDVVVMDFGMARREVTDGARLTHSGIVMGTPAYMSPEQARGDQRAIGPATDIYSLGVILYELLTGERPYTGSLAEVLGKILHVEPQSPSAVRPSVDLRLAAICQKAMAKTPAERYGSMKDLAADLTAYLTDHSRTQPTVAASQLQAIQPPASDTPRTDEMLFLGAQSADLKAGDSKHSTDTVATVAAAAKAARIPLWQRLTAGACFAVLFMAGIIFFARTPTTTVVINIESIDLKDSSLTFWLDRKNVTARELEKPIELTVGSHELSIYRGKALINKYTFHVSTDAGPRIELKEESPQSGEPQRTNATTTKAKDSGQPTGQAPPNLTAIVERLDAIGATYKRKGDRPDGTIVEISQATGATDDDLLLLQGLPELRYLHIGSSQVTERGLPHLVGFSALENLEVNLSDADMEHIAKITRLKRLCLSHITDEGMKQVAKLSNLEEFNPSYNHITSAGLVHLQPLKKLRVLCLNSTQVDDAGLVVLKDLPALETLWLGDCLVTDAGLAHLEGHPALSGLIVGNPNITDAIAARLTSLKKLNLLWIDGAALTDASVEHLSKIKTLTNLSLRQTKLTVAGIDRLRAALPGCNIEPRVVSDANRRAAEWVLEAGGHAEIVVNGELRHVRQVSDLPVEIFKLTNIVLEGRPVSDSDLLHYSALPDLAGINLNRTQVTEAGLDHLVALPNLRHLHLVGRPITDAGLARLANLKLQILNLTGTQVTDQGLAHLSGMTTLEYLWLGNTNITDEGVKQLRSLRKLIELGLNDTHVTDRALEHLEGLGYLIWLFLGKTQVSDAGLAQLSNTKLGFLDLSETKISDAGIERLRDLQSLRQLWLAGTAVTDRGLQSVAQLPHLFELRLEHTAVSDVGLAHLQEAKTLKHLGLRETKVTDLGVSQLQVALPECKVSR